MNLQKRMHILIAGHGKYTVLKEIMVTSKMLKKPSITEIKI